MLKLYNKKIIKSGNVYEFYEYEIPKIRGRSKDEKEITAAVSSRMTNKEKLEEIKRQMTNKLTSDELGDFLTENSEILGDLYKRRDDNINLTKRKLRRLVNSNEQLDKFITLTFRDNVTNVRVANSEFKKFVKRMNYYLKENGKEKMEYVCVVEFQKRGAVHYHLLTNLKYIKNDVLSDIWGNGFVKINRIDRVDNVGAYIVKYMHKDTHDIRLRNEKAFFTSRRLNRPEEIINKKEITQILEEIEQYEVYSSTFQTEYTGQIRYVQYNIKREEK